MVAIISGIVQLIILIFSKWSERDTEKRKKKAEIQKGLTSAIKSKDTSAINASVDRIRRLR